MRTTISDTQRRILTAATATDDRLVRSAHVALKGGAVRIVLTSMLKRGLLDEVPASEGDHAWWSSEAGELLALKVTEAGCEVIGAQFVAAAPKDELVVAPAASFTQAAPPKAFRADTKQAVLIALLQRTEGATLDEMVAATGWLTHTVRGAMAGALKKRLGMEVRSEKVTGRGRVYWAK